MSEKPKPFKIKKGEELISEILRQKLGDKTFRKVKVLQGRAKEEADRQGLASDDLVVLTTIINPNSPPEYRVEKVEGDIVSYLLRKSKEND